MTLILSNQTLGSLGSTADQVSAGQLREEASHLGAKVRVQQSSGYVAHTLTTPTCTITQYQNPSGGIFEISWSGCIKPPDLSVLLDQSHYQKFQELKAASPQNNPHSRATTALKSESLTILRGGHPRSFHGKAWDPSQVPATVNAEELP